jgi:hypothetical protein
MGHATTPFQCWETALRLSYPAQQTPLVQVGAFVGSWRASRMTVLGAGSVSGSFSDLVAAQLRGPLYLDEQTSSVIAHV